MKDWSFYENLPVLKNEKVSEQRFLVFVEPHRCAADSQNEKTVLVLSPVKLTLIKTKTQFFLSDQIVVIFRHGLVIS
ncbi:hypothetical protein, partial [Lacticaseibacillus paracasei]|uniref:hypothetical protein n=1 Tax=Lacticaseibacillus paracasei TaxID=1597 RepID=UPI00195D1509